jgi:hypothetical protein
MAEVAAHGAQFRRVRMSVRLFGALVACAALMPFVPGVDPGTGVFVVALAAFLLHALLVEGVIHFPLSGAVRWRSIAIVAFLGLSVSSVTWFLANGGEVLQWARAIIPFCFFALYLLLPRLTPGEAEHLARALLFACVLWTVKVSFELVLAFRSLGIVVFLNRLTFFVPDSVMVFPLVAIPLLLFSDVVRSRGLTAIAILCFAVLYLWIGYRGGLIIVLGCFLVRFVMAKIANKVVIAALVLAALASSANLSGLEIVEQLAVRFATLLDEESDGVRSAELAFAWQSGASSPIFGKGLGWQVPFDVAFKGVNVAQLGDQAARTSVGYIHSMPGYFFMNLGLVGLAIALVCYLPWRLTPSLLARCDVGAAAAFASLCVFSFSLTQASFRNIQAVILTVALVKISDSCSAWVSFRGRRRRWGWVSARNGDVAVRGARR